MSDNIIKSDDVKSEKPVAKKATTKKAAPKKAAAAPFSVEGYRIVVFESGASYSSKNLNFTKDNRIQEVPELDAEVLLGLDNFRLPTQEEVDIYLASKES